MALTRNMEKLVKMLRFLSERDQLEVLKEWVAGYTDNPGHASNLLEAASQGALIARERAKGLRRILCLQSSVPRKRISESSVLP